MSVMHHHAVIATTWKDSAVERVQDWIRILPEHQKSQFALLPSVVNGYQTFVLAPDASNEEWDVSDEFDDLRSRFIAELHKDDYPEEEDCSPWDYIEVGFGECGAQIVNTNCTDHFS